jgi:hypothetical protein
MVSTAIIGPKTYRKRAAGPTGSLLVESNLRVPGARWTSRCFASLPEGVRRCASAVRHLWPVNRLEPTRLNTSAKRLYQRSRKDASSQGVLVAVASMPTNV